MIFVGSRLSIPVSSPGIQAINGIWMMNTAVIQLLIEDLKLVGVNEYPINLNVTGCFRPLVMFTNLANKGGPPCMDLPGAQPIGMNHDATMTMIDHASTI